MGELIQCRYCDSPYCKGCNIYILAKMLQEGKFDCLMDEEHLTTIDPASLRPKGEWIKIGESCGVDILECSVCHTSHPQDGDAFCRDCGADMRGNPHDS